MYPAEPTCKRRFLLPTCACVCLPVCVCCLQAAKSAVGRLFGANRAFSEAEAEEAEEDEGLEFYDSAFDMGASSEEGEAR